LLAFHFKKKLRVTVLIRGSMGNGIWELAVKLNVGDWVAHKYN